MFDQILDLVGQPPGSLVYHFIILFAVEAALAISFGQWMREREAGSARLTTAIFVIFLARTTVLVASLLAWRGLIARTVLLPPVERLADTITVIGLIWAFMTMDDPEILRRNFVPDVVSVALLGMSFAGFAGTYYFWFSSAGSVIFNGLWIDIIWAVAQIMFAAVGLIWMLARIRYVYDPFLKAIMLILLGGAAGLHLVRPILSDIAAAMRIGQLIVMPMLAAVAYRHVVEQLLHWDDFEPSRSTSADDTFASFPLPPVVSPSPAPGELGPATPPSPDAVVPGIPPAQSVDETIRAPEPMKAQPEVRQPELLEVLEALGGLLSTLNASDIVKETPKSIATALRSDICLLAIVNESMEQAALVGGYDNIAQNFLRETIIDLSDHPTIVNSLGRLRQLRLTPQRNSRELRDIYERLDISHLGPAYIQPLVNGDERMGLLIVGTPYSERQLSDEERNLLDRLGPLVTATLINSETYEDLREESQRTLAEESARMVSVADDLTARSAELNEAKQQLEEMKVYVRDAYRRAEEAGELREEYERLKTIEEEVEALRIENQKLLAQSPDNNQIVEGADQVTELKAEVKRLAGELEQIRQGDFVEAGSSLFERQLGQTRIAAQNEIAALRARLTQAAITQQEVTFLQETLAAKAREAVTLQARLTEAQAVADALQEQFRQGVSGTRELSVIQGRVADQAMEITELKAELAEARAAASMGEEAIRLQQQMDESDRVAMSQLEAQLAERSALIEALEEQLSEKAQAVAELKTQMAEVETATRNVEKQLAHRNEEIETLRESLVEAREQAQARMEALSSAIEAGSAGESEMHEAEMRTLQVELAEKSAALEQLQGQLQNTTAAMTELEQQLDAANQAVHAVTDTGSSDSHDEVIASMVQELRTPMSSIIGYTDVLLQEQVGILGSLQRKFLQRVKSNTERMGSLLDDLIRITALDKGDLQLATERVDVTYAVEESIMGLADQYREKGLTLRLLVADNIPSITADRDALMQIFTHLLSNAALASPAQGEVNITVDSRRDMVPASGGGERATHCVYFAVEDSGGGIDEEEIDRVFVRKYRADNPLIEGLGDTGVGLSLTKALIDTMGGRIWVESEKGIGTVFHVLLPHVAEADEVEGESE